MKNATMMNFERDTKEHAERAMEGRMRNFFERWAPHEPSARNAFDYDLITLIRTIYAEASAPANAQLLAIMERLPTSIMLGPKDSNL